MRRYLCRLAVAVAAVLSSTAFSDFVDVYVSATDSSNLVNTDLINHTTYIWFAAFDDPEDSLLGMIDGSLIFGDSIYQNTTTGLDLPSNGELFGAIANLAADSFVTIGGLSQPFDFGSVITTPDFDSNAFNQDNQIAGGWIAVPEEQSGISLGDAGVNMFDSSLGLWLVPFMQITLEGVDQDFGPSEFFSSNPGNTPNVVQLPDVGGSITIGWSDPNGDGTSTLVNESVVATLVGSYVIVPAPTSLPLLAIAALGSRRRRH